MRSKESELAGLLLLVPMLPFAQAVTTRPNGPSNISAANITALDVLDDPANSVRMSIKRLAAHMSLGPIGNHMAELAWYRVESVSSRFVALNDDGEEIDDPYAFEDDHLEGCPVVPLPPRFATTDELYPRIWDLEAKVLDLEERLEKSEERLANLASERAINNAQREEEQKRHAKLERQYFKTVDALATLRSYSKRIEKELQDTAMRLQGAELELSLKREEHGQQIYKLYAGTLFLGVAVVCAAFGKSTFVALNGWMGNGKEREAAGAIFDASSASIMHASLSALTFADLERPTALMSRFESISDQDSLSSASGTQSETGDSDAVGSSAPSLWTASKGWSGREGLAGQEDAISGDSTPSASDIVPESVNPPPGLISISPLTPPPSRQVRDPLAPAENQLLHESVRAATIEVATSNSVSDTTSSSAVLMSTVVPSNSGPTGKDALIDHASMGNFGRAVLSDGDSESSHGSKRRSKPRGCTANGPLAKEGKIRREVMRAARREAERAEAAAGVSGTARLGGMEGMAMSSHEVVGVVAQDGSMASTQTTMNRSPSVDTTKDLTTFISSPGRDLRAIRNTESIVGDEVTVSTNPPAMSIPQAYSPVKSSSLAQPNTNFPSGQLSPASADSAKSRSLSRSSWADKAKKVPSGNNKKRHEQNQPRSQ